MTKEWKVRVGDRETTAALDAAKEGKTDAVFVCAHGAGGQMADRSMLELGQLYAELGVNVVRFNFLYREKGSGGPDPMPRLKECFGAVVASARELLKPDVVIIGGRSMGGRAASMLAAEGFACDRVLLLAYPLHPPGQPEKLRDEHLSSIKVPVLCFNGTRDSFCTVELMNNVVSRLGRKFTMHWIEGADHGFKVPKSSGRSHGDVLNEVAETSRKWFGL
jgi:predicted alpha/beta-hydrolase family hydrolase